jgi:hypothetical protein
MNSFVSGGVVASGVVLVVVSLTKMFSGYRKALAGRSRSLVVKSLRYTTAAYECLVGLTCILFPLSVDAGSLLLFTGVCFMCVQLRKRSSPQGCGCSGMNDWDPIGHTRAILRAGVVFAIGFCSALVISTSSHLRGRLALWGIVWFLVSITLYGLLSKRQIPRVIWARLIRRHWYVERILRMDPLSRSFIETIELVSSVHVLPIDAYAAELECSTSGASPVYLIVVLSVMGWRTRVSHIARLPVLIESTVALNASTQTGSDSVIL